MLAADDAAFRAAREAVGRFVRAQREARRLTQDDVAARARDSSWRISRAAVSAIERGQNFPGMEAMLALGQVLHIDPARMLEAARVSSTLSEDAAGERRSDEELEQAAHRLFWKGLHREALAYYDRLVTRAGAADYEDDSERSLRLARLEVYRATVLKRSTALLMAIAAAERAVSLGEADPALQSQAYTVLAGLQSRRGRMPLARDAARRATELAQAAEPKVQGWAWMAQAEAHYNSGQYETACQAYLEARRLARLSGDTRHLTHIEGDIGMCWIARERYDEARLWIERAVELARRNKQPALEASWRIEIGRIDLVEGRLAAARSCAKAAQALMRESDDAMTAFRAEWLLYRIQVESPSEVPDRGRLERLRRLYARLENHDGIEDIREFKAAILDASSAD